MSADPRAGDGETPDETLDPTDWEALRALGHRMVDDVIAYHAGMRERPAWQPLPASAREALDAPLPHQPEGAEAAYDDFTRHVLPYPYGNIHPRAWGWVNGTGTTMGAFAEMLAAAMNPNTWGGQHAAPFVEAQVIAWVKQLLGFDAGASGVLVSGGSVANMIALAVARDARAGDDAGTRGLHALAQPLAMYASSETHNSVDKTVGLLGIGREGLRSIAVDAEYRIDVGALEQAIMADRAAGFRPVCVIGNAGTVNTGAIDDLNALADLCGREGTWLHVDGAFGALAAVSPALRSLVSGMERADSIAFDLHKWLYMPIEVGCVLVRDPEAHRRPFSPHASYLDRFDRGVASGPYNYSHLGPQLTRGFRALKVWLSLKTHGTDAYVRLIEQNVRHAKRLEQMIAASAELEVAAPVPLNVVCFRWVGARPDAPVAELNALNRELLMRLQESGTAVPSSTVLGGRFVMRVALTNHRTRAEDLELLVDAVTRIGMAIESEE